MSAFFNRVNSDLAAILAQLGQTFIIATDPIACAIVRPALGNAPMEGGSWDEYSGQIITRLDLLATDGIPVEGQQITVDAKPVFVGKVKQTTGNPVVTIMFSNHPLPQ